jgi:hypothetical protein
MQSHPVDDDHPSARGQLVLLVEDERSIAEPFAEALRRSGWTRANAFAMSQIAGVKIKSLGRGI